MIALAVPVSAVGRAQRGAADGIALGSAFAFDAVFGGGLVLQHTAYVVPAG